MMCKNLMLQAIPLPFPNFPPDDPSFHHSSGWLRHELTQPLQTTPMWKGQGSALNPDEVKGKEGQEDQEHMKYTIVKEQRCADRRPEALKTKVSYETIAIFHT